MPTKHSLSHFHPTVTHYKRPNIWLRLSKQCCDVGELSPEATVRQYLAVQTEGTRSVQRSIEYYNLDMILAIGYRVRSHRGTQFRRWATERMSEYLIKGK